MNTKTDLELALREKGFFTGEIHPLLMKLVDCISAHIPKKMKLSVAAAEAIAFTAQFRRHIQLFEKKLVPINAITFVLAQSGANKDRTVNTLHSCFQAGYEFIDKQRVAKAEADAKKKAEENGHEDIEETKIWKRYYKPPKPILASVSTNEGLIKHMNELEDEKCGAIQIYSGEFGDELCSNPNMTHNLTLLSEMYDLGKKESKVIKGEDGQSKPIKCLPFSALFIGSQDRVLLDDSVKSAFKRELLSKLGRRIFLNYNPDPLTPEHGESIDQLLAMEKATDIRAIKFRDEINDLSLDIARHNFLYRLGKPLEYEVYDEITLYRHYNECLLEEEVNTSLYEISEKSRKHAHWRALKLAGALAILDKSDLITKDHYRFAVNFVELIDADIFRFEDELRKEKYEQFIDYMRYTSGKHDKFKVGVHQLRKLGFVGTKNTKKDMKDISYLACDADKEAVYEVLEDGIQITKLVKTDSVGVSYKAFEPEWDKERRVHNSAFGYEYRDDIVFADLAELLSGDFSYLPFKLLKGHRTTADLAGDTKWICLDVDETAISASEMHEILEDLNHHIALTTDPNNVYRYRVLLELDSPVDVSEKNWKKFLKLISTDLMIKCDLTPKAQAFIGWSDREVLSVTDKHCLPVKHYLTALSEPDLKPIRKVSGKDKQQVIDNAMDVFHYAFEAEPGKKRALYKMMRHAYDLGLTYEETIQIMNDVVHYWTDVLDGKWFAEFLEQTKRVFGVDL